MIGLPGTPGRSGSSVRPPFPPDEADEVGPADAVGAISVVTPTPVWSEGAVSRGVDVPPHAVAKPRAAIAIAALNSRFMDLTVLGKTSLLAKDAKR
ncbi:hypothetical protein GCM10017790_17760 [Amycolatopsis oliviviridis]|uniref:Uncharacterized protein n=1 Tax=Amycolatopsis oliviviridis TaxID=1471590 RepID=A0ABQ3L9I8_9PSEU|nr:hypothetical protein GCM10017790_17760 [Amycolatopsis oliviviridis]